MTMIGSESAVTASYTGSNVANKTSAGADFAGLLGRDIAGKSNVPEEIKFTHNGQTFTARRLNIELKPMKIAELPEEEYQKFASSMQTMLEMKYRDMPEPPDLSNYAPVKSYADVMVGGKVVATIDNQGCVTSSNAVGARLRSMLEEYADVNGTNGPDLAQLRAEKIAALLGGKIVKSSTAMTQNSFNAYPPFQQPEAKINYAMMKLDPMYQNLQKMKEDRAAWLAKQADAAA